MCPTSCRDRFQLKANGAPHFEVIFDYCLMDESGDLQPGAEHGDCNARVKVLNPDDFHSFPICVSNGFELIGKVMTRLNELLAESEQEFYADMFYNEDGESVEHSITFC